MVHWFVMCILRANFLQHATLLLGFLVVDISITFRRIRVWLLVLCYDVAVDVVEATRNGTLKCQAASASLAQHQATGNGLTNDGVSFTRFPVVGPQNLIMTAGGCQRIDLPQHFCSWDPWIKGLVYFEFGVALPLRNLRPFLANVKLLRAAAQAGTLCDHDFYSGIFIQFVKKMEAYLGNAQNEDVAILDIAFTRGDNATLPRLDMDVNQVMYTTFLFLQLFIFLEIFLESYPCHYKDTNLVQ